MRFKTYFEAAESKMEEGDLQDSLKRIPKSHRALMRGYSYSVQGGNTLKGDDGHIGLNDLQKKKIIVAAPWRYGREFAFLHEVGHCVWAKYIAPCAKKTQEWSKIAKGTKGKVEQDIEELFCHAYANTYAKHKIEAHNHPQWERFVKSLV